MAIFAVILDDDRTPDALDQQVKRAFAEKHFRFSARSWFVAAQGKTSREVAEGLGVKKGGLTGVAVLQLTGSYWGVANPAMWEWLKASFERSDG